MVGRFGQSPTTKLAKMTFSIFTKEEIKIKLINIIDFPFKRIKLMKGLLGNN
jgi:hypothetical protein